MKAMDANLRNEVVRWQEKLFNRSVRRQMRLREIKELIGITTNQTCLEITAGDGVISARLRDGGGRWKTMVLSEAVKAAVDWFVDDQVEVFPGVAISEPDGTFDVVVIVDALERIRDDYAFIKECHRV
jgi:ubiquinone/menaquinone biosynthesis C-methylase UbiE